MVSTGAWWWAPQACPDHCLLTTIEFKVEDGCWQGSASLSYDLASPHLRVRLAVRPLSLSASAHRRWARHLPTEGGPGICPQKVGHAAAELSVPKPPCHCCCHQSQLSPGLQGLSSAAKLPLTLAAAWGTGRLRGCAPPEPVVGSQDSQKARTVR